MVGVERFSVGKPSDFHSTTFPVSPSFKYDKAVEVLSKVVTHHRKSNSD